MLKSGTVKKLNIFIRIYILWIKKQCFLCECKMANELEICIEIDISKLSYLSGFQIHPFFGTFFQSNVLMA